MLLFFFARDLHFIAVGEKRYSNYFRIKLLSLSGAFAAFSSETGRQGYFWLAKKNEASIGLKAKNELCNWLLGHVEPVAYSRAAGGPLAALQAKCGISVSVCIKET
jgi:hypothetical protein